MLRRYYVGMTRAKRTLTIHTNGNLFDSLENTGEKPNILYIMCDDHAIQAISAYGSASP